MDLSLGKNAHNDNVPNSPNNADSQNGVLRLILAKIPPIPGHKINPALNAADNQPITLARSR